MPTPRARWNSNRDCWESLTDPIDLLSGHSVVYSETWPTSGSMRNGLVSARPTSAPLTDASASSSSPSLPTPTARDSAASGGSTPSDVTLTDAVVRTELGTRENPRHLPTPRATRGGSSSETERLLPTPEAKLANSGPDYARADREGSGGDDLLTTLWKLRPTPTASDGTRGGVHQRDGRRGERMSSIGMLLPTPLASDSEKMSRRYGRGNPTLRGAAETLSNGVSTSSPSDGGSTSSDG